MDVRLGKGIYLWDQTSACTLKVRRFLCPTCSGTVVTGTCVMAYPTDRKF